MEDVQSKLAASAVYCQCCGKEKLAEIRDGHVIIYDTRHGRRHFVVLQLSSLLTITTSGVELK